MFCLSDLRTKTRTYKQDTTLVKAGWGSCWTVRNVKPDACDDQNHLRHPEKQQTLSLRQSWRKTESCKPCGHISFSSVAIEVPLWFVSSQLVCRFIHYNRRLSCLGGGPNRGGRAAFEANQMETIEALSTHSTIPWIDKTKMQLCIFAWDVENIQELIDEYHDTDLIDQTIFAHLQRISFLIVLRVIKCRYGAIQSVYARFSRSLCDDTFAFPEYRVAKKELTPSWFCLELMGTISGVNEI
jgi:hypothetical protein